MAEGSGLRGWFERARPRIPDFLELAPGGPLGCLGVLVGGVVLVLAVLVIFLNEGGVEGAIESDVDAIFVMAQFVGAQGFDSPLQLPDLEPPDAEEPVPEEPAAQEPISPIASSGSWQFTQFEGQMDCDGLAITIAPSNTISGEIAVLEDGRLLGSGVGDDLAEVLLELDEDAPEPETYVGAIAPQDAAEGVELVVTITFVDDDHATTHIGGAIVSDGVTCFVDRPGEAIFTG
jgi:hypothetical protein